MRVVVTGATGFIGPKLVAALEARGDEVIVVSRSAGEKRVTWKDADAAIAESDAVVHLAGANVGEKRWTPERIALLKSSRVDPTSHVARAIANAKRKPRVLVSASAVGIYGMRKDDAVLDENARFANDTLADICVAWEVAAAPAREAGVRVAHPRIGIVLGKDGGVLAKMLPSFRFFVGGAIGDGAQWVSWIHWKDTVRALLFAIDDERMSGPFNVTASEPVTMGDLARAIGETLHRPSFFKVPPFAIKLAVGEGFAEVVLTGQRAVPKRLSDLGFRFDFPDLRSALRDLLR